MGFYSFFGVDTPFDADKTLVSSNVITPFKLGVFRLVLAFYIVVALIVILIYDGVELHQAGQFFSYFTNLCYVGLCAYFWASSVQTLAYAHNLRHKRDSYPLQSWPQSLQLLHVWLTTTANVFPFVVTIVFWSLLSDGAFDTRFSTWKNISVHAMNSVFGLLEIFLSRDTQTFSAAIPIIVIGLCYVGVAYITYDTQGFYVYDFLDPKTEGTGVVIGYILGILFGAVVVLVIVKGVCWVRDKVLGRFYCPPAFSNKEMPETV